MNYRISALSMAIMAGLFLWSSSQILKQSLGELRAARATTMPADRPLLPDVRFGSCVDGSELARAFFTFCRIGRCSHVFGL